MRGNEKDLSIETLRGLACLFLVLYHVIGPSGGGLKVPDDSIYRYINNTLVYIRMPLFTFLSGYVYALRPVDPSKIKSFLKGKFRRLYLPIIFVGIPFGIIQYFAPGANNPQDDWWGAFAVLYRSQNHFWFLQSLIVIFLLITIFELLNFFENIKKFAFILAISFVIFLTGVASYSFFSLYGAGYLLPFFLLGMGFKRYPICMQFIRGKGFYYVIILFFISILLNQLAMNDLLDLDMSRKSPLSLFVGILSCTFLLSIGFKNMVLCWIGMYSFTIYLFHTFFTGFSRLIVSYANVDALWIYVLVGLLLGIFVPILLNIFVISKSKVLSFMFLGKSLK
ncbi:acyltransferase family protein [Halotalea alkalilenta]|uniref:acyltransferase family protein n=1 Tax=Halotalea alkalilenta TaxID=376489 RepID=UPI000B228F78|nr:acyltransferase [Halotalea alkalilenta]